MKYFIVFISLFLFYCSSSKSLVSRGLSTEERKFFIIQSGYGLTQEMKDVFLKGLPCIGMDANMVFSMYGAPDFNEPIKDNSEYKWTYIKINKQNSLQMEVLIEFVFDNNNKINQIIGDPCKVINKCE
jgi:hypothetical protein